MANKEELLFICSASKYDLLSARPRTVIVIHTKGERRKKKKKKPHTRNKSSSNAKPQSAFFSVPCPTKEPSIFLGLSQRLLMETQAEPQSGTCTAWIRTRGDWKRRWRRLRSQLPLPLPSVGRASLRCTQTLVLSGFNDLNNRAPTSTSHRLLARHNNGEITHYGQAAGPALSV